MTIALWCVLVAGIAVLTLLAKSTKVRQPQSARMACPAAGVASPRARQQNSWEAFACLRLVLVAHLAHGPQPRADMLAIAFIVARLIYVLCYVTDKALDRWFGPWHWNLRWRSFWRVPDASRLNPVNRTRT